MSGFTPLSRPVLLKCKNDWCDRLIWTKMAAANHGVYCAECKPEAKRLNDRNWYHSHGPALRAHKAATARRLYRNK